MLRCRGSQNSQKSQPWNQHRELPRRWFWCILNKISIYAKIHFRDLQDHFKNFCHAIPVFRLNSAKYGIGLNSYLLPILLVERGVQPIVVKENNQLVSFRSGNVQLIVNLDFLSGATNLDSFPEAYKIKEAKVFTPFDFFNHHIILHPTDTLLHKTSQKRLPNFHPLEENHRNFESLFNNRLSRKYTLPELKLSQLPSSGTENNHYLQKMWEKANADLLGFLRCKNNSGVVATVMLEVIQKTMALFHNKATGKLKLRRSLPNLNKFWLHKSTSAIFNPHTETNRGLQEIIREDLFDDLR